MSIELVPRLGFFDGAIRTRAILIVFEKLTRACFFQIALETILLPIQILRYFPIIPV